MGVSINQGGVWGRILGNASPWKGCWLPVPGVQSAGVRGLSV